jgi:thioredoxin-related protein
MVQVISTDLIIKKQLSQGQQLKLLSITAADETGIITVILKNENINFANIGNQLTLKNVKIEIINGYIVLIADENSSVYENRMKPVQVNAVAFENNFSRIKISYINIDSL